MDALMNFWNDRSPRDKAIYLGIALLCVLAFLFLVLIEPAASGIKRLERGLPQARKEAAQFDSLLNEVKNLKAKAQVATVSAQEARGAIEKSLAAAGLKASRIVPLSDGDLQLTFTNASYATWATWLATTERELGARTTSVVANATAAPGNADIELALRMARR